MLQMKSPAILEAPRVPGSVPSRLPAPSEQSRLSCCPCRYATLLIQLRGQSGLLTAAPDRRQPQQKQATQREHKRSGLPTGHLMSPS